MFIQNIRYRFFSLCLQISLLMYFFIFEINVYLVFETSQISAMVMRILMILRSRQELILHTSSIVIDRYSNFGITYLSKEFERVIRPTGACGQDTSSPLFTPYPPFFNLFFFENGILLLFYIFLSQGIEKKMKKWGCCVLSTSTCE